MHDRDGGGKDEPNKRLSRSRELDTPAAYAPLTRSSRPSQPSGYGSVSPRDRLATLTPHATLIHRP